jgi:hypothetical protein
MKARIDSFDASGLTLRSRREKLTLAYREILTAEHLPQPWRGLRIHVLKGEPIRVRCRGAKRVAIEYQLRRRGVRIVDEYGAMITPTFLDFNEELAKDPLRLRQSSDDA